jgi:predicted Fe-Mo cluster-binding NifX family protein
MTVAIPRMGEMVAPCFEYCATMAIFTIVANRVVDQVDFPLRSRDPFDRVRLLRDQEVDTVICGGMQDIYEDLVRASGFEVISWVSGSVEDLLNMYLRGQLVAGTELPGSTGPHSPGTDHIREQ